MLPDPLERRVLLASPELDFSFGAGGISTLDFHGVFYDFRLLPDGKFLVAGNDNEDHLFIARYGTDGLLDPTFDDDDGMLTFPEPPGPGRETVERSESGFFTPDGKLVIVWGHDDETTLLRFNPDGSPDRSFGSNGSLTLDTLVRDAEPLPDGRMILIAGVFRTPQLAVRLNVDGSVDESFRGGLAAGAPLPADIVLVRGLVVAPDGKIYFNGQVRPGDNSHADAVFGRMNADGSLDTSFGVGGIVSVIDPALEPPSDAVVYPHASGAGIGVDAQGRLVVSSVLEFSPVDNRLILTRFTATGARDTTFGGGDAWIEIGLESFGGCLFTPDGKILAAGETDLISDRMSLRRFNSDGTPDATFGEGGLAEYVRKTLGPQRILFDQSGNLLVAGRTREHVSALARLVPLSDNVSLNAEGVLSIDGTGGHDTVSLRRSGDQLLVHRNGGTRTFAAAGLKKVVFWGYTGNDSLTVPFALDADLHGFAGNDTFTLGDGDVTIDAGSGAATIVAGNGTHKIVAGNGHNSIRLGSGSATVNTGSGNDTLITGDGHDSIVSGDGDDSIITGGGNDIVYTGHGNDEVAAGAGDDVIQAFASRTPFDSLEGPELELPRDGGNGRKLYFGEAGDDYLVAGAAGTRLFGGEGDDEIYGNVTNDSIAAGGGDDTVRGAPGSDTINGGPGHDLLYGDREFDSPSDGGDFLLGADGNDSLFGQAGDDTLLGGAGANGVDHGPGEVSLVDGVLTFDGTDSDDEVSVSRNTGDGGIDVWIEGFVQRFAAADVSRIALFGRGGNDVLKLHPSLRIAATLDGGAGDDVLLGGAASDELRGSDGGDYLSGFAGDDYLNGGRGEDALRGGDGKDELDYSSRTGNLIVTLDDVQNDGEAGERDYAAPDIERVRGGSGNDAITGTPWLNLLYGNAGDDTLSGGAGADGLYGAGGNDRFDGGAGDDYVEGGAGNDELHGSGGVDQLFGLGGNDRIFAAGDGAGDVVRGGDGQDGAASDDLDDVLAVETAL